MDEEVGDKEDDSAVIRRIVVGCIDSNEPKYERTENIHRIQLDTASLQ